MSYYLSAPEVCALFDSKIGYFPVCIGRYGPFYIVKNAIAIRLSVLITGRDQQSGCENYREMFNSRKLSRLYINMR